jgi:hypothetical protein
MNRDPIEVRVRFMDVNGAYGDAVGWIVRERLLEAGVPLKPSKVGDPNVSPAAGTLYRRMSSDGMEMVFAWVPHREAVDEVVPPAAPARRSAVEPPHAAAVATVIVICLALLAVGFFDDQALAVAYVACALVGWVTWVVPL